MFVIKDWKGGWMFNNGGDVEIIQPWCGLYI